MTSQRAARMGAALRVAFGYSSAHEESGVVAGAVRIRSSSHMQQKQQQRKGPGTHCSGLGAQDAEQGAHLMLAPQGLM